MTEPIGIKPGDTIHSLLHVKDNARSDIAKITPDGEIVITATRERLEELASLTHDPLRPYAILFLEILRLREQIDQIPPSLRDWI